MKLPKVSIDMDTHEIAKERDHGQLGGKKSRQNRGDTKTRNGGKLPQILKGGIVMIGSHITVNYKKMI